MRSRPVRQFTHIGISNVSIVDRAGYYEVYESESPVSKHKELSEAQWIKSALERDLTQAA